MVGVLVLVDEHMTKTPVIVLGHIGEELEDGDGGGDEVVEVECVRAPEPALVVAVGLGESFLLLVARAARERLVIDELVLQIRDLVAERTRRKSLRIEFEVAAHESHESLRVERVVDRERRRHPQPWRLLAQDAHTRRVEGGDPHRPSPRAHDLRDAVAHLASGLVGEGNRQDLAGAGIARGQQVRDAPGEHPGLARARPRDDEQGPAPVLDSGTLLGVEIDNEISGHDATVRGRHGIKAGGIEVVEEGCHRAVILGWGEDTGRARTDGPDHRRTWGT
ncbi:unannotated protein [freshwater metagenome]|uniref:Unannotated protein n=1 Tax=freshwater metagenome TaxID=449393 RepID=A0A6J7BW61_9ZZZZ